MYFVKFISLNDFRQGRLILMKTIDEKSCMRQKMNRFTNKEFQNNSMQLCMYAKLHHAEIALFLSSPNYGAGAKL